MEKNIHSIISNRRFLIVILIIWGFFCGWLLTRNHAFTPGSGGIDDYRADRLVAKYQHLLEYGHPFDGVTGVQGNGYYLPYFMKLLHIEDGYRIWYFVQAVGGAAVITIYPIVMYFLLDSFAVAIVSPFVVHFMFGDLLYISKVGIYFGMFWIVAIGIPLVLLMIKVNNDRSFLVIVWTVSLMIAISNILRCHAGVSVFLASMMVVVWKLFSKRVSFKYCIFAIVLLILNYGILYNIPRFFMENVYGVTETRSAPWHAFLIGLGWIHNDYGLIYDDDAAYALVYGLYPELKGKGLCKEYWDACKKVYFSIILNDPIFALKCYATKMWDGFVLQVKYILGGFEECRYTKIPFVVFSCGVLIVAIIKKDMIWIKRVLSTFLFSYIISIFAMAQGFIAVPVLYYCWGSVGGAGVATAILFMYSLKKAIECIPKRCFNINLV